MTLRVALVGGPMYDHLYSLFDGMGVQVDVHADHPSLNRIVGHMLEAGERIDVLSTHSKYAPSQAQWLIPLDGVVATDELAPLAVDLCRAGGDLRCVPRLVDVRIMWARRDRVGGGHPPDSWAELLDSDLVFGFPGRESGLFGTFFELVVGAGGALFDHDGRPQIDTPEGERAVSVLRRLAGRAPDDLPTWHYDQVDAALIEGRVDASGAWPGASAAIRRSALADLLEPHPYPRGAQRWVSYAGCHAWAIPTTCGDFEGAAELVRVLCDAPAQALDASGGNVCAHVGAFADVEPVDAIDHRRLEVTAATIAEAMITYPPHARFPELEEAGWRALHDSLTSTMPAAEVVAAIQTAAEEAFA
jgi:multiple sugar transport system substrate-binding protein